MKKSKKDFIIITVPHAKCGPESKVEHNCEPLAVMNAKKMKAILDQENIPNKLFIGDVNRENIDLNRSESKRTRFHNVLNHTIRFLQEQDRNIKLIDVHSGDFGNKSSVIGYDLQSKKDDRILKNMQKKDLIEKKDILKGSDDNYIVHKAHKKGIEAILIEFNENKDRKRKKNLLKRIIDSV